MDRERYLWTEWLFAWHKLVFKDSCTDLDELIHTVVSYITFCEEMIIPRKTIQLYPNNNPRVSKSLKNTLNKKKIAYYQGDITQQKEAQKMVKREIRLAKDKVQDELRKVILAPPGEE